MLYFNKYPSDVFISYHQDRPVYKNATRRLLKQAHIAISARENINIFTLYDLES